MIDRTAIQALDRRPEDVDSHGLINQALRQAAGRGTPPAPPRAPADRDPDDIRASLTQILGDDPTESAVAFATTMLTTALRAEPMEEGSYAAIAAALSRNANPAPPVRDSAALALLTLDGPGDARLAGQILTAPRGTCLLYTSPSPRD